MEDGFEGKLEWTEAQVDDYTVTVQDVLEERGQEYTDEVMFLQLWRGEERTLDEVLDETEVATAEPGDDRREVRKLTEEEKALVRQRLVS